jgi:hypothetical protein
MIAPIMPVVAMTPTKVQVDARAVTANPTAMTVPVTPPATAIADLFGERRRCCSFNSLQAGGGCRKRRRGERTEGEDNRSERESVFVPRYHEALDFIGAGMFACFPSRYAVRLTLRSG